MYHLSAFLQALQGICEDEKKALATILHALSTIFCLACGGCGHTWTDCGSLKRLKKLKKHNKTLRRAYRVLREKVAIAQMNVIGRNAIAIQRNSMREAGTFYPDIIAANFE